MGGTAARRPQPAAAGHRPAGGDRRGRLALGPGPVPRRLARPARRTGRGRGDQPGGRRSPPRPDVRRPGRLDRQRPGRHRLHHRRRFRAAPHHRGDRRAGQHRGQPPALLRGRGDGPPLRLPGPDGGGRRRLRLRPDPGAPARGGLGGHHVRGAAAGPRQRPPRHHGGGRRGRPGALWRADHLGPGARRAGGAARRGRPGDDPRPRAARRLAERLRPLGSDLAGLRGGP